MRCDGVWLEMACMLLKKDQKDGFGRIFSSACSMPLVLQLAGCLVTVSVIKIELVLHV